MSQINYTEEHIQSLDWKEHIRMRPGMYVGKLGDGSARDAGIYVLLKETLDNSIDEHIMGYGKKIDIEIEEGKVVVRDYGRGIPLGKVVECVSKINTGGKYDSEAFKKSVGLNGVGTKAVNALSQYFEVEAFRDGKVKRAIFSYGNLDEEADVQTTDEKNGTRVTFIPDGEMFQNYRYRDEHVEHLLWNYAFLNAGLRLRFNGKTILSKNGLFDLLERKTQQDVIRYPIMHFKGDDIEMAMTHGQQYGEQYYSFVNGQHTTQGGTHLSAFREAIVNAVRDFYGKKFNTRDVRASIIAAISVRIEEPVFESQTKTKLGSKTISPDGLTLRTFVNNFIAKHVDNYLHRNEETAEALLERIRESEKERKDLAGVKKLAKKRAKKASVHNKKLRDCRAHYNSSKGSKEKREQSTLFITEGDSASGSLTKARDVQTQAVFSLRGKPLNCFGKSKKVVYKNEELNLLQHALDVEDSIENLRYNRVVIATDADVDGMHIRLLLLTFFLQFFPDLVRNNHLYILETPLFRVRNKHETRYCYTPAEKKKAIDELGKNHEITRFKGLGEISPSEFEDFIGSDIRLEPVILDEETNIETVLDYYMGRNTPDRQEFIIDNLKVETNDLTADVEEPRTAEPV